MENIFFGEKGLLIGVIAYPFDCNGQDVFKHEFENGLFNTYKNKVAESFGRNQHAEYKETLMYEPKGYNLFGVYNLAVLSLIDGYAFSNRVFHSGHGNREKGNGNSDYRYQVLTGVGASTDKQDDYLNRKANDTFLLKEGRYPYIALTRLKLNDALLLGTGVKLLQAVRVKVEDFLGDKTNAFTIDTFGNSEIVLLSFADSLTKLSDLVLKVKSLTVGDLGKSHVADSWLAEKEDNIEAFHVFAGSYTHLGYDMEWDKPTCMPIQKEKDLQMQFRWELKPGHEEALNYTKGAYDKHLEDALRKKIRNNPEELRERWKQRRWIYKINPIMCHLTGVNVCYSRMEFNLDTCCRFLEVFRNKDVSKNNHAIPDPWTAQEGLDDIRQLNIGKHLRSLRVQLFFSKEIAGCDEDTHKDQKLDLTKFKFSLEEMDNFRGQMRRCGVSKLTRERIMKMFARFNEYIQNRQLCFIELRVFLSAVIKAISEFEADDLMDVKDVDDYLTFVIQAFDGAFYNRYHQSMGGGAQNDITLEYNGGIQQYVSSFSLSFQDALKVLNNIQGAEKKDTEGALLYLSGYEGVISHREIMRINMNLITYPELFATSIYKEAGNFILERTKQQEKLKEQWGHQRICEMWHDRLVKEQIPGSLRTLVRKSNVYRTECTAHRLLTSSLNTELIEYFVADIHNLYFGFNGNVELLYYYYWKYFLQLSSSYKRNGEMKVDSFVSSLLRLFIILFYDCKDKPEEEKKLITQWEKQAFDPRLSSLWQIHFPRVLEMAKIIWSGLKNECFQDFIESEIFWKIYSIAGEAYPSYRRLAEIMEKAGKKESAYEVWATAYTGNLITIRPEDKEIKLLKNPNDFIAFWKKTRQIRIARLEEKINRYELLEKEDREVFSELFVSDILIAYLNVIHDLDKNGRLKSLLRDTEGTPYFDAGELNSHFSPLLSDPQGGIFTHGLEERAKYFGFRTVLYKSLWHYSMKKKKEDVVEQE